MVLFFINACLPNLRSIQISVAFILLITLSATAQNPGRTITSFDKDWRFLKDDAKEAEKSSFDDSKWRRLDVPHDWSIEGPYDKANSTSRGGGYLPAGIGWYRKTFSLDESAMKKKISIEFDGVMANSDVWINGFHLGKRPYGYISFSYDLSGHLEFGKGKTNVIAVRADNSIQPASRYYTGAGIYRHVRLVTTDPVHISQWGVYITTSGVSDQKATVKVQTNIVNQSASQAQVILETSILDPSGKTMQTTQSKQTIAAGKTADVSQDIPVNKPGLWNLEKPVLYTAVSKVLSSKNVLDNVVSTFGIRDFKFEAATGFWLNGKNIKIKGVCLHHDVGGIGSAVPLRAWERRLELLRQVGVNGIRTSHNPVAPEFLDLCDRMGFVVMDETFDTWTAAKNNGEKGYNLNFTQWWQQDTRDMVMRDRNHPSIVIYSVGNEIHDNLDNPEGFKKYKDQQDLIHQLDGSRPVTMALFRPGQSHVYENGFVELMDVVGQNYRENELVAVHEAKPQLKVIGTENGHNLAAWLPLRDKPFMAGQFLWTGVDYLGEADWPAVTNGQGLFDRTSGWRPLTYQRQSWWTDQPVVHIVRRQENAGAGNWVANWTPTDFDTYDDARVQVYSNCDEVELFLNGKSLGTKNKPADDSPRAWEVTFEKGSLRAVAKNKGNVVASDELKTAGPPARIVLSADRSGIKNNWDDVSYITVSVVDASSVLCPNADNLITFSLSGPGVIMAVDNGNIASHEAFQASERHVYQGQCIVVLSAKAAEGKIILKATSAGLSESTITIEALK